jgi:hypothetical protein
MNVNDLSFQAVCWDQCIRIRIQKNPKVLAGSESEKSSDSDTDSDPDTVVEWKFVWKIEDQALEREKSYVFLLEIFFFDVQVPEHIWKQLEGPFRKIWVQNISRRIRIRIRIRIRKKLCIRIRNRKKWVRIHNTGWDRAASFFPTTGAVSLWALTMERCRFYKITWTWFLQIYHLNGDSQEHITISGQGSMLKYTLCQTVLSAIWKSEISLYDATSKLLSGNLYFSRSGICSFRNFYTTYFKTGFK